jgi:hypothetical protein
MLNMNDISVLVLWLLIHPHFTSPPSPPRLVHDNNISVSIGILTSPPRLLRLPASLVHFLRLSSG